VLWLALLFGSSSFCAYLISLTVRNYLEYDVVTQITTRLEIPTTFPWAEENLLLLINNSMIKLKWFSFLKNCNGVQYKSFHHRNWY
jgi:hypothetical protein